VFPAADGLDFRIVDWEMADFGDAGWTSAAVLQSFFTAWIMSMPIASGLPPEAISACNATAGVDAPDLKASGQPTPTPAATRRASATASSSAACVLAPRDWRGRRSAARPRRKGRSRRCGAAAVSLNVLETRREL